MIYMNFVFKILKFFDIIQHKLQNSRVRVFHFFSILKSYEDMSVIARFGLTNPKQILRIYQSSGRIFESEPRILQHTFRHGSDFFSAEDIAAIKAQHTSCHKRRIFYHKKNSFHHILNGSCSFQQSMINKSLFLPVGQPVHSSLVLSPSWVSTGR